MLSREWLATTASVGAFVDSAWEPAGAGFVFKHAGCAWLVTAAHVIQSLEGSDIGALFENSDREGGTVLLFSNLHTSFGVSWVIDDKDDLAISVMPTADSLKVHAVEEANCLRVRDVIPSMQCYSIGCPNGIHAVSEVSPVPLVLDGTIVGVDRARRRIFCSVPTFPGNSGGPLIAVGSPFAPDGSVSMGPTVFLAGVMTETVVIDSDPTSHGVPTLHLGSAVAIDRLIELLNSDSAREHLADVLQAA